MGRPRSSRGGDINRTGDRVPDRSVQQMEQCFLQRASGAQPGGLHLSDRLFLRSRRLLDRAEGLPALPQPVASDPLAELDDEPLSRRLAARRQSLPDAVARRCRRQPGSAHRGRHPTLRGADACARHRAAERGRHARLVHLHSVDPVQRGAAASVRPGYSNSRLSGLGRLDLRAARNDFDPSDRLAAGRAQFPATAL